MGILRGFRSPLPPIVFFVFFLLLVVGGKENTCFLVLVVGKKTRKKIKIKKKVKFGITFGNKKEANDSVATGILPQYGDPHWG